jgi:guanine deaminase
MIVRAQLFHTPTNPFLYGGALVSIHDGALAFGDGRILEVGDFAKVSRAYPDAGVKDARGSLILPGMVDTHVHYPQIHVIGAMGLRLLDWLRERTLPEEVRLKDPGYARLVAKGFLRGLLQNGTTTALVFGAHFAAAQEILFEEAHGLGLRLSSGLVISDRNLHPALESTPEACYEESRALVERWHGRGRLRYAVTPRFSVSCSEAMLEVAGALLGENPEVMLQTHLNENVDEIALVGRLFPWAGDYLETYERYGLVGPGSVFAHNVHVSDGELIHLAQARAAVAHCPSSNAFIGSGLFNMRRHLEHGVRFGLGTDVGGGTGFSLLKEGLAAYACQMLLQAEGYPLTPAHLLYLATLAGAKALGLADEVGDFTPGKSADFVLIRPPKGSTLEAVLAHSPTAEAALGAVFTLAREESVREVYIAGSPVFSRGSP